MNSEDSVRLMRSLPRRASEMAGDYPRPLNEHFQHLIQVVIATSTIALQEQLDSAVRTVLKMTGVKAKVEESMPS